MFGFIKKVFFKAMTFFNFNSSGVNSLERFSMNNQECRTRTKIINNNNNEPVFYPFSIRVNKCSGSCNNINDPYARSCVLDVFKNMNLKIFNLISWSNHTKQINWHESCKCECKLNSSACNNKQRWNKDKCRCECKELVNKQECDKGFIWNPSNCECEYKKRAAYSLVKECEENIDENKIIRNQTLSIKEYNKSINKDLNTSSISDPCKPYIASSILFLLISVVISRAFVYFYLNSCPKKELQTYYY